jgi:hypothetical protein
MGTAPELLEEKEVAVIMAVVSLLGRGGAGPTQVQEAYQKALGQVKEAQTDKGKATRQFGRLNSHRCSTHMKLSGLASTVGTQ